MAEEFRLDFASSDERDSAARKLEKLFVDGKSLMKVQDAGESLLCGCAIFDAIDEQEFCENEVGGKKVFDELFYPIHGVRSGRHAPEGIFWIRNFRNISNETPVRLTSVMPAVLQHFGIPAETAPHSSSLSLTR